MTNDEQFLAELSTLANKHKIIISSCGCCNSPFTIKDDEYSAYPEETRKIMQREFTFPGKYIRADDQSLQWTPD